MKDSSVKKEYAMKINPKHVKVMSKIIKDNKPVSHAIEEVYGSTYNGNLLQKTKSWQALLKTKLKDDKLMKVLNEGLDATVKRFKNNVTTGEVEEVIEEPDHAIRHKFMDTGFKLKGYYPKELNQTNVQVNINKFKEYE